LEDYLREVSKTSKRVDFSLLIPAYNEKKRLPDMLPVTINVIISLLILKCIVLGEKAL